MVVNSIIEKTQKEYNELKKTFIQFIEKYGKEGISWNDARTLFKACIKFDRLLEAKKIDLLRFKGAPFYERAIKKLNEILELTHGPTRSYSHIIEITKRIANYMFKTEKIKIYDRNLDELITDLRKRILRDLPLQLDEFYEDLKLLAQIPIYFPEDRLELQSDLVVLDFKTVAEYLSDADACLLDEKPRIKDCLTNCRLALEEMVYRICSLLGVKTSRKFSIDLTNLRKNNPDILDEGLKRLIQGVYGFLSDRGAHVYSEEEKETSIEDAKIGLTQTYNSISVLLDRYKRRIQKR